MNNSSNFGTNASAAGSDNSTIFSVSVNSKIVDKPERADFGSNFLEASVTIEQLAAAIKKGFAWSCSTYKEGKRKKANFIQAQTIGIDIDDGLTLDEALNHPFYRRYGLLAYTSVSHQREKAGKVCDRYRLVFALTEPVTDSELYERAVRYVMGQFTKVDEACKDSSRYWAGNRAAEIYFNPGEPIPIDSIPAEVPPPKRATETTTATLPLTYTGAIPIEVCLSKANRELLAAGVGKGSRNPDGFKLACDLIGVGEYLRAKGHHTTDDPRQLFDRFCDRCDPPLDQSERGKIWDSATASNPTSAIANRLGEDSIGNCIGAYIYKMTGRPSGGGGKVINHPRYNPPSPDTLKSKIDEIIERGDSGFTLESNLTLLAAEWGRTYQEVERLYRARVRERESEEDRGDYKTELDTILTAEAFRLDVGEVLPDSIANPLKILAGRMSLRPEAYLTMLLSVVSALHHKETRLLITAATSFSVSPNLYTGFVAESSQRKSPIIREMIEKPLKALQRRAGERYKEDLRKYNEELRRYETLKKGKNSEQFLEQFPDGPPEPPKRAHYITTDATFEAIAKQFDSQDHGLVYVVDELAGLFKSLNQYRGGKGRDEENLLSLYDGGGLSVLRKNGEPLYSESTLLAVCGSIQPEVLRDLLGDGRDSNGKWARFLFCYQPTTAATFPETDGAVSLELEGLYQAIADKPATTYRLSAEARSLYATAYNEAEKRRVKEVKEAFRHIYGKMPGLMGKLALNLHLIKYAHAESVPIEVSGETMRAAIKLTRFYFHQVKFLLLKLDDSIDNVPGHLAKILELAKKKGDWLSWRDVQQTFSKKQRESAKANFPGWIDQLAAMGYGETTNRGGSVRFKANVGDVGQCRSNVGDTAYTVKPIYNEISNQNVGDVGHKNQKFSDSPPPPPMADEKIDLSRKQPTSPTPAAKTQSGQGIDNVGRSQPTRPTQPTQPTFSTGEDGDAGANVGDVGGQPTQPTQPTPAAKTQSGQGIDNVGRSQPTQPTQPTFSTGEDDDAGANVGDVGGQPTQPTSPKLHPPGYFPPGCPYKAKIAQSAKNV